MKEKENNKIILERKGKMEAVATGIASGFLNGLFGGGGGMIVVPMLSAFNGFQSKNAHATAILIMLPFCILSGIFYASTVTVNVTMLLCCMGGVVVGGVIGALALSKLASKWIRIIFSLAMFAAGFRNLFF